MLRNPNFITFRESILVFFFVNFSLNFVTCTEADKCLWPVNSFDLFATTVKKRGVSIYLKIRNMLMAFDYLIILVGC